MFSISDPEKLYIEEGIRENFRADGRSRLDYRPFSQETSLMPQANGSALLQIGDSRVLVSVRLNISEPSLERPDEGKISCSVDWSGGEATWFQLYQLAGGIGDAGETSTGELRRLQELAITSISQKLLRVLQPSSALDLKDLCLVPGSRCWEIGVDCLVLAAAGNIFDAISVAARAALLNCTMPNVKIVAGDEDGEVELELSDDPLDCKTLKGAEKIPVCVTLSKIGSHPSYIADPRPEEECCATAQVTVAVNNAGLITNISKTGVSAIDPSILMQMLEDAQKIGTLIISKQDALLVEEKGHHRSEALGFLVG